MGVGFQGSQPRCCLDFGLCIQLLGVSGYIRHELMQCSPEEASPGNGPDGVYVCERRYKDPLERALRIAAGLKRKNVRDVALRLRWVAVVQANKKRKLAAAGLAAESDAKVQASLAIISCLHGVQHWVKFFADRRSYQPPRSQPQLLELASKLAWQRRLSTTCMTFLTKNM